MERIKLIAVLLLLLLVLAGVTSEFAAPRIVANCAECGDGPRDKKCPKGYRCVKGKCVKR